MAEPKVEVVISGIGGLFPESENLDELKTILFNKENAVTSDSRKWTPGLELGKQRALGKIKSPQHFDCVFFGIHRKMAESLDPLTRLSLERAVEAVVDAGINPADLSGTNTAVFMSSTVSESEFFEMFDIHYKGFGLLGHNRAMQANRLSYALNLNETGQLVKRGYPLTLLQDVQKHKKNSSTWVIGDLNCVISPSLRERAHEYQRPSYTIDSTWIGGAQAIMRAKKMIEDGVIDTAIIGSCNLCLNSNISLQLEGLGRLNDSNETRSFCAEANGMSRGESCVVILLQRATDAKRSYGTILSAIGVFGETNDLFYHYSENLYKEVLLKAYKEADVDPSKVAFVECEGLGILKIDAMELNVLSEVFCSSNRKEPLKIGSIKSNIGHCEAASSLVSLAKALIVLDSGYIPPNINYLVPNPLCPALISGKLEVVTEKTPLNGDIIGISSFGLCNSFSHIVLKQNKKNKTNLYEKGEMFKDGLPRLLFISGRNEDSIKKLIENMKNSYIDEEYAALIQSVFCKSLNAHHYRTFCLIPENKEVQTEIAYLPSLTKRPVWFIFSGMGSQWSGMGKYLLNIPIFAESIRKCDAILKPKSVDIYDILTNEDPKLFDNILNSFVGIAAIQIGLVDVLRSVDIYPDGIIGHSVGELGCAYADGCFTAEQMILAAHARGRASIETKLVDGMMAAIGLGYNDIKDRLPHDIEVACHNASDSSTLSGPTASVKSFVEQLKSEGVFAKAVNVSNIAYHSQYIKPAAPTLLKYLKEVVPDPKPRSSKWISSSIPENEWNNELAQKSSPEYHTNNLLSQVLFEEASQHIPEDAITIEIAPHGLLQAILKRSLSNKVTNIPLTHRGTNDSVKFLLNAVGKMYLNGMTPNIEGFYPTINYPVSRGTPILHSLLSWDHTEQWMLKCMSQGVIKIPGERRFSISLSTDPILADYKIRGRHIVPNSIILFNIWKSFLITKNEVKYDNIIGFQDLNFRKNIEITNDTLSLYSFIQSGTGRFELCLEDELILTGKIYTPDAVDMTSRLSKMYNNSVSKTPHSSISKHDLYTMLEFNGYELGEKFRNVSNIDLYFEEYCGNIKWNNDWISFINGIFSLLIHKNMENNDNPAEIANIRELFIDPSKFQDLIGKDIPIYYDLRTNEIFADGLYVLHPEVRNLSINELNPIEFQLEEERFIKLNNPNAKDEKHFINNCVQIINASQKIKLGLSINCYNIYYSNDNQTMSQYITLVKQILDTQIGFQHTTISLDKVNSETITNKDYYIVLLPKNKMKNAISIFKNINKAFLIVQSDEPLISNKEWGVVIQQKFNKHYLVLLKKLKERKKISIQVDSKTNLQVMYKEIKTALTECEKIKCYLYIIINFVPYEKITHFMDGVLKKIKSKILRFVFILDNSAPVFNFTSEFYAEQFRKNILVNIYKNGEWGTITRNIIEDSIFNPGLDKQIATDINAIILCDLKVKYLGINFQDITINKVTDNELGHLEYSGLTADGKRVMGIAPFENKAKKISPDPYLSWIVPSDWTLEDAATVPLSYSMAYYILTVLSTFDEEFLEHSILIHAGFNAIGQAAIAIALASKFTLYVTVENEDQAKLLKNKFPLLSDSRIFSYKDSKFEVKLRLATKGMGISIILNCLSGTEFYDSTKILAKSGKFFQLAKTDMKNKEKLGLYLFLKVIGFYAVSPDSVLNQSKEVKLKIKNEVQKGIDTGIIKPFERHVLTGPCTGEQAIKALNLSSQGIETKRVVLSLEGENGLVRSNQDLKYEKYHCHSNRVYFIVGGKYSTWMDLVEWLIMRGARKIVVSIKKYAMSTTISRRFNLLMTRYQNIMIQVVSDSNLNTKEDTLQLIMDISITDPLAGIFFTTLDYEKEKMCNVQYAIENLSTKQDLKFFFVCLMSGGEKICTELRENGVCPNAVSISWNSLVQEPKLSNLIPSLDKVLTNFDKITSSTIICTEYNKEHNTTIEELRSKIIKELPESIDELNTFGETIVEEPEFVEVITKSPLFSETLVGIPVFVVPGFRPERTKLLYKTLIYPAFEARLPENIDSVEDIARALVKKIKLITKNTSVSLIGMSWGGVMAIIMAQILEAENIAVSLTLIEGIPKVLHKWTKNLIHHGSINSKLVLNYFQTSTMVTNELSTENGWNDVLPKVLSSSNLVSADQTLKALNAIRSRLNALITLKYLPNRLLATVTIINRDYTVEKTNENILTDFCDCIPTTITFNEKDYNKMLLEKELSRTVNQNILHFHPDAMSVSIKEFYNRAEVNTIGLSFSK